MRNNFEKILFSAALLAVVCLAGCAGVRVGDADRDKLLTASNSYNSLLRWRELDKACINFAEKSVRGECLGRVDELKDLQITDVRRRDVDFEFDGNNATVHTEIEYYLLPSMTVKKIQDVQRWCYSGPQNAKAWRITTLFPLFVRPR